MSKFFISAIACFPFPITISKTNFMNFNAAQYIEREGPSTNGANLRAPGPGGEGLRDKGEPEVGVRGALFGSFLGKQKGTKAHDWSRHFWFIKK